jgi:hypothetical protein
MLTAGVVVLCVAIYTVIFVLIPQHEKIKVVEAKIEDIEKILLNPDAIENSFNTSKNELLNNSEILNRFVFDPDHAADLAIKSTSTARSAA